MDFHTTLLREKFTLRDIGTDTADESLIATSNRMTIKLYNSSNELVEEFVIRAQNMFSCIRMTARIALAFDNGGSLLHRGSPYDWKAVWLKIIEGHEENFNPNLWIAVYSKGNPVFTYGDYHSFLDIIEKCDMNNPQAYEKSVALAEKAFSQMGKPIEIEHESNVGLVMNIKEQSAKCGIVLRNALNNATFNFAATAEEEEHIPPSHYLNVSAAFLEGIQLSFTIGMTQTKLSLKLIDENSVEHKEMLSAEKRIEKLNREIETFENSFAVSYRPERPNFKSIITDAKKFARGILEE